MKLIMKTIQKIGALIGVIAAAGLIINAVQAPPAEIEQGDLTQKEDFKKEAALVNDYNVYALPMPDGLNFAGEEVPVHNPVAVGSVCADGSSHSTINGAVPPVMVTVAVPSQTPSQVASVPVTERVGPSMLLTGITSVSSQLDASVIITE